MQHAVFADPGLQVREPALGRQPQHGRGLARGQQARDEPQGAQRHEDSGPSSRRTAQPAPFRIRHAPPLLRRPVTLLGEVETLLSPQNQTQDTGRPPDNLPQLSECDCRAPTDYVLCSRN